MDDGREDPEYTSVVGEEVTAGCSGRLVKKMVVDGVDMVTKASECDTGIEISVVINSWIVVLSTSSNSALGVEDSLTNRRDISVVTNSWDVVLISTSNSDLEEEYSWTIGTEMSVVTKS